MSANPNPPFSANPPTTSRLRVFGVGAAGLNILETLMRAGIDASGCVAVDTDADSLDASSAAVKLRLETPASRGEVAGDDPEHGRVAAEEHQVRLSEHCSGAQVILIIAGMGGCAGTGISPVLARVGREVGALVLACVVTPFEFVGSHQQQQAQAGLQRLRAAADAVLCLPNQKLVRLIDERTGLVDAYQAANDLLVHGLRGLVGLLVRRGLIPIHLHKLCALLRGRHAESTLAAADAHGPNRALDVVEKLFAHPLLEEGRVLADAESVVVSVCGGSDLSLSDLNRVMEQINGRCENMEVLMGATVDEAFRERLSITLIATRREERAVAGAEPRVAAKSATTDAAAETPDEPEFLAVGPSTRARTRLVPPAPSLPPERIEQWARQNGTVGRPRKLTTRLRQGTLPLEVISRGRFDKTEPNLHRGEDLDTPTYLRRGLVLN